MKERIKVITALDLLFLFVLIASGLIKSPTLSELCRYTAFLFPIALGYAYSTTLKTETGDRIALLPRSGTVIPALLAILPAIALTALLASAASALRAFLFDTPRAPITEAFLSAILVHALIPTILEEILFRYLPVRILGRSRYTVFFSALMFSLAHTDLISVPHTFFAGAVLALLVIVTGSILPSMLLHFLNNVLSLTLMYYPESTATICIALGVGAAVSLALLISMRKRFAHLCPSSVASADDLSYAPLIFIGASIFIIITESFI